MAVSQRPEARLHVAVCARVLALAGDEVAARSLGVDTRTAKVKVFVLSAVLASLAGSLYAHTFGFVSPDTFGIFASVDFVTMVVVGGLGVLVALCPIGVKVTALVAGLGIVGFARGFAL